MVHPRASLSWPFVETPTHWISTGMDRDLNVAFQICLRNMLTFMVENIGLQPDQPLAVDIGAVHVNGLAAAGAFAVPARDQGRDVGVGRRPRAGDQEQGSRGGPSTSRRR